MDKLFQLRHVLVLAICVPLAIVIGYAVTDPFRLNSLAIVGGSLMALSFPMLIRGHHLLLVLSWNATINVFLIPGQPRMWMLVGALSLLFSLVQKTIDKKARFLYVPSVAWPMILLLIVVTITAYLTGGIGARALGAETFGGKRYAFVVAAILGFFALACQPIPPRRAMLYVTIFFLSGITAIGSNVAYALGPNFYFLFALFPTELASLQARGDELTRLSGAARASLVVFSFMLLRYGIRGIFDLSRPWRPVLFFAVMVVGLFGGFRSTIILYVLIFSAQFCFEGLFRSSLFPKLLLGCLLLAVLIVGFADKLPLSFQRSLSFLPVEVNPIAKRDATSTLDWRVAMWKVVLPDVPKYLLVGKGFSYSGTDYQLMREAVHRGRFAAYEATLVDGNYHNGWLTLIIPFGIWGLIAFAWFCWAGLKVLYANYRWGDPTLRQINTFLLAYFVARLAYYVIFYGQFDLDLFVFTGIVGLSIAVNHGVRSRPQVPEYSPEIPAMSSAVATP